MAATIDPDVIDLGSHLEFGPVEMGDGRRLTSHVYSGLPRHVTVDVIEHPNGMRTMTILNPSPSDGAHLDWKVSAPRGTDVVSLHGGPKTTFLYGSDRNQKLSPQQLAAVTRLHGLGNRPIKLLACRTGAKHRGFAYQYAQALGQPVTAPTEDFFSDTQDVGHGWIFFRPAKVPWRTFEVDGQTL